MLFTAKVFLHSVPRSGFPTGARFDLTVMEKKDGGGGELQTVNIEGWHSKQWEKIPLIKAAQSEYATGAQGWKDNSTLFWKQSITHTSSKA